MNWSGGDLTNQTDMNYKEEAFPTGTADSCGMTLRDYFAAKAMQSLFITEKELEFDDVAWDAYRMADAMMAARKEEY